MGIKAPGLLAFFVALTLALVSLASRLGIAIPAVDGHAYEMMLAAYVVLLLGCTMRGL